MVILCSGTPSARMPVMDYRRAMRITGVALALVALGCSKPSSPTPADPPAPTRASATPTAGKPADAVAESLAKDDLLSVVASAHLSGEWSVSLYWDQARKATVADARLVFATDPSDPLAMPPYVSADQFRVDIGPPAKIVSHADPEKLRKSATQASRFETALKLARAELVKLPRYRHWQQEKWGYETVLFVSTKDGHVIVTFDTPAVTDNDIRIEIDPDTGSVVRSTVHME